MIFTEQEKYYMPSMESTENHQKIGSFLPDKSKNTFGILMPPPNANGSMHLGHALGGVIMDVIARFHRLMGDAVLLQPGKDHAGIQTQATYMKKLQEEGREVSDKKELFRGCMEFCLERKQYMQGQEKRLGISADFDRDIFTLDSQVSNLVQDTFIRMYKAGLAYRKETIINYCPFSKTAISDIEVDMESRIGKMYIISYTISSGESIAVATSRPETMYGDVALAVNPRDERYNHMIGLTATCPLTGKELRIIGDEGIDKVFGTGVVKITPAHSAVDFEISKRHGLSAVQVIDIDGRMKLSPEDKNNGLRSGECRVNVVDFLDKKGSLQKVEEVTQEIPISERSGEIVEPIMSSQWFISVNQEGNSLKEKALDLLEKIEVHPADMKKQMADWLNNMHDWNISRQIFWGHSIPFSINGDTISVGEQYKEENNGGETFDTWFSSCQWPYSTLETQGLMDTTGGSFDLAVMGRDLVFFWAARMLIMSSFMTGVVPWKKIYFTNLVRDKKGQKMSKSKGNGIDPIELIDKYGADALRAGMLQKLQSNKDIRFSEKDVEDGKSLITKIWNSARFVAMYIESSFSGIDECPDEFPTLTLPISFWVSNEFEKFELNFTTQMNELNIYNAFSEFVEFFRGVWCDWYLEFIKSHTESEQKKELAQLTKYLFGRLLHIAHTLVPFVSEELLTRFGSKEFSIIKDETGEISEEKCTYSTEIEATMNCIKKIRFLKNAQIPDLTIIYPTGVELAQDYLVYIQRLTKLSMKDDMQIKDVIPVGKVGNVVIGIHSTNKEQIITVLDRKISSLEKESQAVQQLLENQDFVLRAQPDEVVAKRRRLKEIQEEIDILSFN